MVSGLKARIRAVTRRSQGSASSLLTCRDLSLDEASAVVTQNDENFSLSNVIRYTAENGPIDVSLSTEGNIAVLEALDAESGENDEDLDQVFTPFYPFPRHDGLSPTDT